MIEREGKPRGYLTLRDILHTIERLDESDLDKPLAVSEKTCGLTNNYLNDDTIIYGVRLVSKYDRKQDFNGWLIEGLSKEEILEFNKGEFGGVE